MIMSRILSLKSSLCLLFVVSHLAYSQGYRANSLGDQASSSYVIQPLDYVLFRIIGEEADVQMRVSNDGKVVLPYVKAVDIAGMTVAEAQRHIYSLYNGDYFIDPQLDLTIYANSAQGVEVMGYVMRQGRVPIPAEENLHLLEAISLAGGAQALGDLKNVTIRRTGENGEQVEIKVDTRGITTSDYPLQNGDLIEIPRRRI